MYIQISTPVLPNLGATTGVAQALYAHTVTDCRNHKFKATIDVLNQTSLYCH